MSFKDHFLPEYDQEMATTRRTLERVPYDKADWKPHEKSMAMGRLAGHVAELPGLGLATIKTEVLDFATAGMKPYAATDHKDTLAHFDKVVADTRAAIAAASDEDLMKDWTLAYNGKVIFKMPRAAALRSVMMNHSIHHRGQLSVYLRLNNVPVPALYGPSADEGGI